MFFYSFDNVLKHITYTSFSSAQLHLATNYFHVSVGFFSLLLMLIELISRFLVTTCSSTLTIL